MNDYDIRYILHSTGLDVLPMCEKCKTEDEVFKALEEMKIPTITIPRYRKTTYCCGHTEESDELMPYAAFDSSEIYEMNAEYAKPFGRKNHADLSMLTLVNNNGEFGILDDSAEEIQLDEYCEKCYNEKIIRKQKMNNFDEMIFAHGISAFNKVNLSSKNMYQRLKEIVNNNYELACSLVGQEVGPIGIYIAGNAIFAATEDVHSYLTNDGKRYVRAEYFSKLITDSKALCLTFGDRNEICINNYKIKGIWVKQYAIENGIINLYTIKAFAKILGVQCFIIANTVYDNSIAQTFGEDFLASM